MAQQEHADRDLLAGNTRYKKLQDLNEGTFGVVMLALDTQAREQVCVPASAMTLWQRSNIVHASLLSLLKLLPRVLLTRFCALCRWQSNSWKGGQVRDFHCACNPSFLASKPASPARIATHLHRLQVHDTCGWKPC